MPAMPAIPTAEYSSTGKTFSISRFAIIEPIVARRSPAITTPPATPSAPNVSATIVVACGASGAVPPTPCAATRCDGRRSGACPARKSRNDDDPGVVNASGSRPGWSVLIELPSPFLLAALLHEAPDEGLRVRLQHLVDLLEEGVDLGVARLRLRRGRDLRALGLVVRTPVLVRRVGTFGARHHCLLVRRPGAAPTLCPFQPGPGSRPSRPCSHAAPVPRGAGAVVRPA